ncbi:MAG: CoA pyrophosphatase [Chloroflexota bacterium]
MKAELKELLARRRKRRIDDAGRVPSAVLLPVFSSGGQFHLVFIKRSDTVKTHRGQISFPGGAREIADKTLLDTAFRESQEEIGLRTKDVEILGEMDDEVTTTSNYVVTPFVGMMPWPYDFVRNEREVDEILEFPIPALLDERCHQPDTEVLNGRLVDSWSYHCQGRLIWGATARILNKFLEIYARAAEKG